MRRLESLLIAGLFGLVPAVCYGHFHSVFVEPRSAAKGQAVTVTYWVGHPYEHILTDAPKPEALFVVDANGKKTDLAGRVEQTKLRGQEARQFMAWKATFVPQVRGDYCVVAVSSTDVHEGAGHKHFVKAILHCRVQKGWDRPVGLPVELVPLTRPYGLQPNVAFRVQVLKDGKRVPGAMLEVERYNPAPVPEESLPPDEQITRVVKADGQGVAVMTLFEPGWWAISAEIEAAEGSGAKVVRHATLWVYVDEAPAKK